jgi:hypothetical protein
MVRALTRFTASPPPPQHVGGPLRVGETALLRRPNSWLDLKVELRGLDGDLALVLIIDKLEVVPLRWVRRK